MNINLMIVQFSIASLQKNAPSVSKSRNDTYHKVSYQYPAQKSLL